MSPAEAIEYLQQLVISERQQLIKPKVATTPYIEALELAVAVLRKMTA